LHLHAEDHTLDGHLSVGHLLQIEIKLIDRAVGDVGDEHGMAT
jgi:hypothetical protein